MSTPILELPPGTELPQSVMDELNMRLLWIGKQLSINSQATAAVGASAVLTLTGTRSQRLGATKFTAQGNQGAQFYETDTALVYVSRPLQAGSNAYVWGYLSGISRGAYASLPQNLGKLDAGLLYTITDKNRTLRWTGTAWEFAPWEVIPVGYITGFPANPGTGWHICDGSTVASGELHADGTLHNVTFDDLTSASSKAVYPKWGPLADGAQVAIAPLITGNTADATTAITVSAAAAATASTGTALAGATQPVVTALISGGGGGGAVTDPGHHHAHGTLVNDALGEPRHYDLIPYQRV